MRLPSMSALFESHQEMAHLTDQEMPNAPNEFGFFHEIDWGTSSHAHPSTPTSTAVPVQITSPAVEHTAAYSLPSYASRNDSMIVPYGGESGGLSQPLDVTSKEILRHSHDRAEEEPDRSFEREDALVGHPYNQEQDLDRISLPHAELTRPSTLLPSRKRKRKTKAGPQRDDVGEEVSEKTQHGALEDSKAGSKKLSSGGPFIHGLCGKGFAARSKVKKHHWGGKINKVDTATGCWAKHNKPNAEWNDHPSCKVDFQVSITQARKKVKRQTMESTEGAPIAPAMTEGSTDFPSQALDIGDDPQIVAEAPRSPRSLLRYAPNTLHTYHSHQLPRSPLDALLTAVNVASQIEEPVPRGRNDLVLSQLDAQALAAEREGQFIPTWAYSPQQYDPNVEYTAHHQHHDMRYGQSFGTSPLSNPTSLPTAYLPQMYGNTYASSVMTPTDTQAYYVDHNVVFGQVDYNPAP